MAFSKNTVTFSSSHAKYTGMAVKHCVLSLGNLVFSVVSVRTQALRTPRPLASTQPRSEAIFDVMNTIQILLHRRTSQRRLLEGRNLCSGGRVAGTVLSLALRSGAGRSHPQGLSSLERASSLLSGCHKADTVG